MAPEEVDEEDGEEEQEQADAQGPAQHTIIATFEYFRLVNDLFQSLEPVFQIRIYYYADPGPCFSPFWPQKIQIKFKKKFNHKV